METKQTTLTQMAEEWRLFLEAAQGFLPEEQVLQGAVGHWSVKDLLVHIAAGDLDVLKNMETYLETEEGKTLSDYGPEMDRLNEAWVVEKRGLPFDEVWEYLDSSSGPNAEEESPRTM